MSALKKKIIAGLKTIKIFQPQLSALRFGFTTIKFIFLKPIHYVT